MHPTTEMIQKADLGNSMAAERTFLAWVRTGLAMMGFGFVVARFALFLQEFQVAQHLLSTRSNGLSSWFGTSLIVSGVFVNVFAGLRHARLIRRLDRGETSYAYSLLQSVAIAFFLALVGLAMAIYLISVGGSVRAQSTTGREVRMTSTSNNGITDIPSNHSVDETVERLKSILQAKGVTLFALVDHSGEAEKVGMKMPPTKLMIFGNPKAGTPVMLASRSAAIDLPLKILIWEDPQGKVWISYNNSAYLQERHNLPTELLQNISVVETLATKVAE